MKLLRWRTCCLVRVTPTQLVLLQARTVRTRRVPIESSCVETIDTQSKHLSTFHGGLTFSQSTTSLRDSPTAQAYRVIYILVSLWVLLPRHSYSSHTMFNHIPWEDKMLKVEKNNENRSLKTNRLFPTANKPDPMPQNLAFLFTKITPEQMIYMWNVLTAIFVTQVLMVIGYCAALATFPEYWWTCTLLFGIPFSYIAIQQMLVLSCFLFLGTSWRMVLDV